MLIQDTFAKDIFRPIDPVVRADEDKYLANELDEFVVTNEVERHLLEFFEEYNERYAVGNGAWISGFFGSGKSHLLKILAVVIEDRMVDGKRAMDYLLPKVAHNSSLKGAMEVARDRYKSESVLFDIDHIAPNEGRAESGALLAAFIRAFNTHRGYFDGDQQHIAQLEWDLDRLGRLDEFRAAVLERCKMPWEIARNIAPALAVGISAAYDEACGNAPGTSVNIVDYYRQTYSPSINSFAKRVRDYIEDEAQKLPPNKSFRLNFFVDEVGLFIARNPRLMVNLQSVAEELNTICGGNSWVVVTSQESMEGIISEMGDEQGNTFSKIGTRFNLKMPLTSQDAKTVIRDRLLAKTAESEPDYYRMYEERKADFGVLFDFADGAKRYGQWPDFDGFLATYPFVPYQFDVFMTAMRELSRKDAFTGKHNSTGARSMLGVFQDVAQELCRRDATTEEETLAPFDLMFEGLRNSFRTEFYAAISQAEQNPTLADPLCARLLKALLLVKYCRDFKATPGNLRVLLYGSFRERPSELEQRVKDALDELERQTYVRRNGGNEYEYLTDEEKEVENEIKSTQVSETEAHRLIARLFQDVVGPTRVTYKNGAFEHVYSLNLKVDGEGQGTQRNDLTLDLVTDFVADGLYGAITPTQPKTLAVRLVDARAFLLGVRTHLQTERYANKASGAGEVREAIITDKRIANQDLYGRLKGMMTDLLTHATYNAGGADVTDRVRGTGKDAVQSGMLELVRRSYSSLQQVPRKFSDKEVWQQAVATQMITVLPEYCETVLARIGLLSSGGTVTVAGDGPYCLTNMFTKNEFGWPEVIVRSAVATLFSANRVEVKRAGKSLAPAELATALQKRQDLERLVVEKVDAVGADDLSRLKAAMRRLMGNTPSTDDPKAMAAQLAGFARSQAKAHRNNLPATSPYPFSGRFTSQLSRIEALVTDAEDWHWVVYTYPEQADELASVNEDLAKMAKFAKGSPMRSRYDEVRTFVKDEAQEAEALGVSWETIDELRAIVSDELCYSAGRIPKARKDVEVARKQMAETLSGIRSVAKRGIKDIRSSYESAYNVAGLTEGQRDAFYGIFDGYVARAEQAKTRREAESLPALLKEHETARILAIVNPPKVKPEPPTSTQPTSGDDGSIPPVQPQAAPPSKRTVAARSLLPKGWGKPVIATPEDAQAYADALRDRIVRAIEDGDIVTS